MAKANTAKALVDAISAYVAEGSKDPEARRTILEHMNKEDRAAYKLLLDWVDPRDLPHIFDQEV